MQQQTVDTWLSQLADRTPTPGGGAAAAMMAATASALIGMVASYTTGPKWTDRETRMRELGAEAATIRTRSLEFADADAVAFKLLQSTYKLPSSSEEEKIGRTKAIQLALTNAAKPPNEIIRLGIRLVEMCDELLTSANPNMLSDVAVAASATQSALESAITNIAVNARLIRDETITSRLSNAISDADHSIINAQKILHNLRERLKI